ncbi:MAG TPA: permease [Candidatus Aquilonibacter sp.]|nr:permease [Candidatus Aquilonibacter sp.]
MDSLWKGLYDAAVMLWDTLWALVLGFSLSAFLRVFLRREQITKQFGRDGLREVALATFLGAVSSSCSYAASSAAKTAFKKGAALVPTLAFMFASTNLVIELGFILWLLLGWPFLLAEIIGAFILIGVMWLLVKLTLPKGLEEAARAHNAGDEDEEDSCGCHSGGDEMESDDEPLSKKIRQRENWTQVAHAFFMETAMLWKEIGIGFLIAGFLMALVPESWWGKLFITSGTDFTRLLENAVVGPLIGALSFTCSCGNIPLASVLWSGGISFGGVISFIYADLIIIPLIFIYRKYYGGKAALYLTAILFVSMASAGIIVDLIFSALGLIPAVHLSQAVMQTGFEWNYTTWLDLAAILWCAWLVALHFKNKRPMAAM